MQRVGCALLVSALVWTWAETANAEAGVAFVHGTGTQTNALHDYWTRDFVDSVAAGLSDPDNFVVVDCDFSQYMWKEAAAGCMVDQLLDFARAYEVDELVIITHSHGGNVVRWVLSNPTWDPRYAELGERVAWVDALAPSSLGTPLADAVIDGNTFETSVGWLLGYENDAVRQQQVSHMAYYNANWMVGTEGRPELPVGFWAVVGTDVQSSPFDQDSYCGGYPQGVGLEFTQNWLSSCSDGFLDCSSQGGAGDVWFYDYERTADGEPLSHAQSRRPCFGLDAILRADMNAVSP